MAEKLTINKENGENLNVDFVSSFTVLENQKQYLITTNNEIDPNGLIIMNVSEISSNKLDKVGTDEDWNKIKQVMRSIISSSPGEYKYLPMFNTINATIDYSRNISVQVTAKDQLVKDYYAKKPSNVSENNQAPTQTETFTDPAPLNPALGNVPLNNVDGSVVAPGIVEVPKSTAEFENVSVTENPTDLIVEPNVAAPQSSPAPQSVQPMSQPVSPIQQPVQPTPQPNLNVVNNQISSPITQPVAEQYQPPIVSQPNNNSDPLNNIVDQAREVFIEAAKNLADVIISNAFESIRKKEEELRNREVIVAQREMALNQQSMGMQYNQPQVPPMQ